ncbi:Arf-GAP with SH3 domain, ANK repeat and PH domain-containing protein 1 [Fukomys damarensis]|uniref:Arf-GAP with SH3 domain, ANK repeat and PH domain-containing protein 1 n=1 Tax=Fukomys damarensis TaxID=885580 RepID=A0A091DTH8_FUKDA|nr:Arf-GAP with SH3 domain, ANK repeat and PH domain-containing protein 1 [Fukomys damarensis]
MAQCQDAYLISVSEFISEVTEDYNSLTIRSSTMQPGTCRNTIMLPEENMDRDGTAPEKMKGSARAI